MIFPSLAYRPFLDLLPVWDAWYLLILPLCVAVAVVWKSMKCATVRQVPREAAVLLVWIFGGFVAAAGALMLVVHLAGR